MSSSIEDLLHRRTDLSTFLIHFTRDYEGSSARENLINILRRSSIDARTPYGMGRNTATTDAAFQDSQLVVCFTETPIEHAWMMCESIEGRENGFAPYGLAFTKSWARRNQANPVWYLDMTPRAGPRWLTKAVDEIRDRALTESESAGVSLAEHPIARLLPFLEQMGPTGGSRKEWWWEREWRRVGSFVYDWQDVVAILSPVEEHEEIFVRIMEGVRADYPRPPLLDPRWGLERMISALRGVPERDAGPLPKY